MDKYPFSWNQRIPITALKWSILDRIFNFKINMIYNLNLQIIKPETCTGFIQAWASKFFSPIRFWIFVLSVFMLCTLLYIYLISPCCARLWIFVLSVLVLCSAHTYVYFPFWPYAVHASEYFVHLDFFFN